MKKLDGKVVIITGGGSGIGRAASLLFAREGAKVVVADISDTGGGGTVDLIRGEGGQAIFVSTDVRESAQVEQLIRKTIETFGKLDILYNSAGIVQRWKPFEMIEEDEWENIYATNVKGTFLTAKFAIAEMKKAKGGVIINTASIGAVRVRPSAAAYQSSKGAVIVLTKALAIELAPYNVRVNCINPVATDTPMVRALLKEGASEEDERKLMETINSSIPLGRMTKPEEIAKGALFLACDESSMITGLELNIDGGRGI